MRTVVLIAHNLRSTHNVGAILRSAEGLGVVCVYLSGYTPYPATANDERLPYMAAKIDKQIHKTALGAERLVSCEHVADLPPLLQELKRDGYRIVALEQAEHAIALPNYSPPAKLALLVGREVEGLEPEIVEAADEIVEIPMSGQKESFNVSVAAAIALFYCCFYPF